MIEGLSHRLRAAGTDGLDLLQLRHPEAPSPQVGTKRLLVISIARWL